MSKNCLGSLTERIQVSRIVYLRQFKKEIWKDGPITLAVIKEENYHDEQNKNNILKLRKVLDQAKEQNKQINPADLFVPGTSYKIGVDGYKVW